MQHLQNEEVWWDAVAATIKQHSAMLTDLLALHEQKTPLEHGGVVIRHALTHHYLSGLPYPWSGFADRAFRFPNYDAAAQFIKKYDLHADVIP